MISASLHPAARDLPAPPPALVDLLLDAAEPLPGTHALVIGADTLETLCGLIRRDCGSALEMTLRGRVPAERAELVLVPHVDTLSDASQAIMLARRTLLPCGRIVLHDADGRLAGPIARLLRDAGFSAVRLRSGGAFISADWPMFGLRAGGDPHAAARQETVDA